MTLKSGGSEYSSRYVSELVTLILSPSSLWITSATPSISEIIAWLLGTLTSKSSSTRGRPLVISSPTTPPVWKVRRVSWVPGSPMLWAAIMPELTWTLVIPASVISLTFCSSISSFWLTMVSPVWGLTTLLAANWPVTRSASDGNISPSCGSDIHIPAVVPQSFWRMITSWATSMRRRVR